jgi:hypothetical protein
VRGDIVEGGRITGNRTLLHHYTRSGGLLGVIGNGTLWATHLRYLNDSREFEYVFRLAVDYLERIDAVRGLARSTPALAREIERVLPHFHSTGAHPVPVDRFVVSLSEQPDDLSQWRAYGSLGDAYSVDFDADTLRAVAASQGWTLEQVGYGENARFAEIVGALTRAFRSVQGTAEPDLTSTVEALGRELSAYAPLVKHEAFSAESEWRLISPPIAPGDGSLVKYRPGRSTLVPYVELGGATAHPTPRLIDAIVGVTVGPGPDNDLAATAVLGYLGTRGIHVGVGWSDIPYRSV